MANRDENIAAVAGDFSVVYATRNDRSVPAKAFLETLPRNTQMKMLGVFEHVARMRAINISRAFFRPERGEFWAFCGKIGTGHKLTGRMIRFPCFRLGNRLVITHGFVKEPQSRWEEEHFTTATEIMEEVLDRERRRKA